MPPVPSPLVQAVPPEFSGAWATTLLRRGIPSSGGSPPDNSEETAISRAKVIKRLIDADSHQAETQTESGDFCVPDESDCSDSESLPFSSESELPFLSNETEETGFLPLMDKGKLGPSGPGSSRP